MNVDSILISDYAHVSHGKLTVVGVFNRIGPAELPLRLPTLAVSMVIHAHHDEAGRSYALELRLIDENREVINRRNSTFTFSTENMLPGLPLRVVSSSLFLAPSFEHPGAYAFEVYIDGTYHAAASFVVVAK